MLQSKQELLEHLHELVSHNVAGSIAYKNRYNGFYGELSFNRFIQNLGNRSIIEGGVFIPTESGDDPFKSSVYFTVSEQSSDLYIEVYSSLTSLAKEGLYFFQYSKSSKIKFKTLFQSNRGKEPNSRDIVLPFPDFKVFKFSVQKNEFELSTLETFKELFTTNTATLQPQFIPRHMKELFRSKLEEFSLDELIGIYFNRLIFDGLTGGTIEKGSPLDIDLFTCKTTSQKYSVIEVKEKDLSKSEPIGFGLDIRRISSLLKIEENLLMDAIYVVRQVDDQERRNFLNWKYISLMDFCENVDFNNKVVGGPGMADRETETVICPDNKFKTISIE